MESICEVIRIGIFLNVKRNFVIRFWNNIFWGCLSDLYCVEFLNQHSCELNNFMFYMFKIRNGDIALS